jgi:hypothetical protein
MLFQNVDPRQPYLESALAVEEAERLLQASVAMTGELVSAPVPIEELVVSTEPLFLSNYLLKLSSTYL